MLDSSEENLLENDESIDKKSILSRKQRQKSKSKEAEVEVEINSSRSESILKEAKSRYNLEESDSKGNSDKSGSFVIA
jgi:hypothetical protein